MRLIVLGLIGSLLFTPAVWADTAQVVDIGVSGMTCPFCVYGTEKTLSRLPGVATAEVSLEHKRARVLMQPGQPADLKAIRQAITDAGFTPGEASVHAVEPKN